MGWEWNTMRIMNRKPAIWGALLAAAIGCSGGDIQQPPDAANVEAVDGNEQNGPVGAPLLDSLRVRVSDASGNGVAGVTVTWSVLSGGGQISPTTSTTDAGGMAAAQFTLGPTEGDQQAEAEVNGVPGSPVVFDAHGFTKPPVAASIEPARGEGQSRPIGTTLPESLEVRVLDANGHAVSGVAVAWSVLDGGGTISPASSITDGSGLAATQFSLGSTPGDQHAQGDVTGLTGSPVLFTATATEPTHGVVLSVAAGGNNVQDRFSSDLWVYGNHAYTGTWGFREQLGNVLNVWTLDASGAPSLTGTVTVPNIGTVSDVQVSDDGRVLVLSGERGDEGGIYTYDLSDPAHPTPLGTALTASQGVHTVTLATINGRNYAFAARNPGFSGEEDEDQPALLIFDITDPANITLASKVPEPADYGIHDTYVRDGLAFAFVWNTGVIIYDVGNGMRGGSPSNPQEISRLVTSARDRSSPAVHNGWWFHNPVTHENRYLFIGQEGPNFFGERARGDIHVVDVSDLAHPTEVAFFHLSGAGTHNFWMDEQRQILYAAYYNAGVIALDVSGTLSGDLSSRLLSQVRPGGPNNTFTWGVQLANGSLYAIDMESGFWQLKTE